MKLIPTTTYLILIFLFLLTQTSFAQTLAKSGDYGLPVLPGVSGFGLDTQGGQGGKIIRVTTLAKVGEGSLAEAIRYDGPRIIVFEVAGVINLERSVLEIDNPYLTIAGQTAPYPGITLIQGGIRIKTHDVIIQHLKVRPGEAGQEKKSGWEVDGIATTKGAYNVIIDHCSVTWSTDENISASGPRFEGENVNEWRENTSHRVVISNCIIAEGLRNSTHKKGEHSKGSLIHDNATEILIFGNLYAHNVRRNPFCKGGTQVAVLNNYIYNPGTAAIHYNLSASEWEGFGWVTGKLVAVGNAIEAGTDTHRKFTGGRFHNGPLEVYWQDNMLSAGRASDVFSGEHTLVNEAPFWPKGLEAMPAKNVKQSVLQHAGAFPWQRDAIDQRIIEEVRAGKGRIIDSEKEVGGYPVVAPVYRKFVAEEWDLNTLSRKVDISTN